MVRGGTLVNKRTAQIIRFAGLILPIILLFYGLLIKYGVIQDAQYINDTVFMGIMAPWLLLSVIQYIAPSRTKLESALRLIGFHIFAGLFVLFISGFSTPFIVAWVLLFVSSYAYFSNTGLRASVVFLILIGSINLLLHSGNSTIFIVTTVSVVAVLVIGLATVAIGRTQEVDGAELSRSKAEESLQRDRILTIVNNLADAVLSTDKDGVIRVYNAACLNLLDTNTSLNGHHINEILTLYDQDDTPVDLFGELRKSRASIVRDDLVLPFDDEKLRLEVTFSPIRGSFTRTKRAESQDGYIVILRDITKAKSLEEERDEFISVVSHELRTPITIAEGTVSNVQLMMKRSNIAKSVLQNSIDTAHEQIIFLAKMVNDLSTLSRAERGVADEPEVIDVRELVNDLYNEYAPQAQKKDLHFNLDLATHLGQVSASRLYLKELLQNFVTNSIKYTKEGSVTLHVSTKENQVTFAIKDTGIGISKSDQAKIFNKFYRSEDYRTRETGGTGLGLYVATKLAKKLGTSIDLTSRLNHGSTFQFSLPLTSLKK
jgi:signal transduction histidine kinase